MSSSVIEVTEVAVNELCGVHMVLSTGDVWRDGLQERSHVPRGAFPPPFSIGKAKLHYILLSTRASTNHGKSLKPTTNINTADPSNDFFCPLHLFRSTQCAYGVSEQITTGPPTPPPVYFVGHNRI